MHTPSFAAAAPLLLSILSVWVLLPFTLLLPPGAPSHLLVFPFTSSWSPVYATSTVGPWLTCCSLLLLLLLPNQPAAYPPVFLPVSLVVFVVVCHQVSQSEAVMR